MNNFLFLFIIFSNIIFSQQFLVTGTVEDKETGRTLSYANIRVMNSTSGTAANRNGEYELHLPAGKYSLVASYIGYKSDTLSITVIQDINNVDFLLREIDIELQEVIVKPGINPAVEIIKKAIVKKNERNKKINDYELEAYTKGIIKTQNEINPGDRSISLDVGVNDSIPLKISGILENKSVGYYKKPDDYKEIIVARKQSANFPPSLNILTGGRLIKNFYEESINLLGRELPGPLAEDALDYYYYYIKDISAIDNQIVYKINMTPDDPSDPGFTGDIFITKDSYNLIKVDLQLNRPANLGGIFDTINVFQQFALYDSVYMPVDYRVFVKANILGLAKFGFEMNSILYDYKINVKLNEDFFDKAVITVLPGADNKSSLYWQNIQSIPNTEEEQAAYKRIDSLKNIPGSFWDDFSILSTRANLNERFSVTAPLGMYHFNRVEGNALDFGLYLEDAFDKRFNSNLLFSYGFADKKFKTDFYSEYLLGDYRTYYLSFNAFKKTKTLFGTSEDYNEITSTILSLVSKYEFRDYYYSSGFNFNLGGEVFPVLSLNTGFSYHTDKNAYVNTGFSIFNKDKDFRENPSVYETKINSVSAGFKVDFRNYIEDGFFRRRISIGQPFILFEGNVEFSDRSFLQSDPDFTRYELNISGRLNSYKSSYLNFRIFGMYNYGKTPYQMLFALPGNIDLTAKNNSFRTLNVNEILGNKVITVHLEKYLGDELFRILNIPGLKDSEILLTAFLNIGISEINKESKEILIHPVKIFPYPFYETGFEIGHMLLPLKLSFAWKINYRDGNNFRFGINTFVF